MIIYNPQNETILKERIQQAEILLSQIPAKHCFIAGSFLYKDKYKDIDIFLISRSKKKISVNHPKAKITIIDFNDLYSLFYHSLSKSCIAKNILPQKPLKITLADYWSIINEAVPTLLNQKITYHKSVRSLILYTEYFLHNEVLDSFGLSEKLKKFKSYQGVLEYTTENSRKVFKKYGKISYIRRFFYINCGYYRKLSGFKAQNYLYTLSHEIINGQPDSNS